MPEQLPSRGWRARAHRLASSRAARPLLVFGALSAFIGGCVIFDDGVPENARVIIGFEGGEAGTANNLRLIVSSNFETAEAGESGRTLVTLRGSDTIPLALPYDESYSLGNDARFFIQVANLDSIPVVLSIKVDLDDDRRMDQVTALGEPVEFLYVLTEF